MNEVLLSVRNEIIINLLTCKISVKYYICKKINHAIRTLSDLQSAAHCASASEGAWQFNMCKTSETINYGFQPQEDFES